MSAGPKSRHIDIRYFWMKDRIKSEGVTIRHCPTLQMVGDFFTKPLQGSLFRKFRDVIMGDQHMNTLVLDPPLPIEERVENIRQSDDSMIDNDTSNGALGAIPNGKISPMSWADVVKGATSTNVKNRVVGNENRNKVFREIILSKQSSVVE